MILLLQYTLIFASVLSLVALGGCISEHSGVINLDGPDDRPDEHIRGRPCNPANRKHRHLHPMWH